MTCATCKHWIEEDDSWRESPVAWRRPGLWGHCRLATLMDGRKLNHPNTLAYAEDAESYSARLLTHAGFSCTQFALRKTSGRDST